MAFLDQPGRYCFQSGTPEKKKWRIAMARFRTIPEGSGRLVKLVLDHFGQTGSSAGRCFQQNICASLARFGF